MKGVQKRVITGSGYDGRGGEYRSTRIEEYLTWLRYTMERSESTVQKYRHCLLCFAEFIGEEVNELKKEQLGRWKAELQKKLSPSAVNCALAAMNGFLRYLGRPDLQLKFLKLGRRIYRSEEKEITRAEYRKVVRAAYKNGNERTALILQTICSTGIRISELPYITVSALRRHRAEVNCKGKVRTVFIPRELGKMLKRYADERGIRNGTVFVTKSGRAIDRSNIWREMKRAAVQAGVAQTKVFPHNFRHLFAIVYYETNKDLSKLADLLGHSSLNTTRIYIMESGAKHLMQVEKLELLIDWKYNNRIPIPLLHNSSPFS